MRAQLSRGLKNLSRHLLLIGIIFLLSGCAPFLNYNREMASSRLAFSSGDFEGARAGITKKMKGEDGSNEQRLNPWLELGLVDHTAGAFQASTQALQNGARIINDHEKKAVLSTTKAAAGAATLIINEKAQPYYGESFEKILIHTFLALNYLMQNDWEGARVETRRAIQRQEQAAEEHEKELAAARENSTQEEIDSDALLQTIDRAYADLQTIESRVGNAYQNAFTHYLSAVVCNAEGESGAAYIELKRARQLRPRAACLGPLMIETADAAGFYEDLPLWERAFGLKASDVLEEAKERPAELLVVFENGWAPQKQQITIPFPTPVGLVKLAIPKNEPLPGAARSLMVEVEGRTVSTTLMGDIEAQAVKALHDRMKVYVIKMIIRVTARVLAERELQQKAQEEHGAVGALAAFAASSALNMILEQADLRAWSLLPRDLQLARLRLPEGPVQVRLSLDGGLASQTLELELWGGRPNVILVRSTGQHLTVHANDN